MRSIRNVVLVAGALLLAFFVAVQAQYIQQPSATPIGGTITGGTDCSVLFVNPAAVLAQDNANFCFTNSTDTLLSGRYATASNCADSAGAAACGSAAAGSFVVDAAATTTVVSTTAITANSQVFVFYDSSLGARLGVTCNTTIPALYGVTARTAATSFTLTSSAPITNPACFGYLIVN